MNTYAAHAESLKRSLNIEYVADGLPQRLHDGAPPARAAAGHN